jgi:hypothetical protein
MQNWRTTLLGLIAGISLMFGNIASNRVNNPTAPPITAGNTIPALAITALGILAKDANNNNQNNQPPQQ